MKTVVKLACPDCGHKFRWPGDEPFPDFCPKNGCALSVPDPDFVPSRLNTVSHQTTVNDMVFRQYEADSIARAEAAVPMIERQLVEAGVPVAEAQRQAVARANDIKVTNLRDHIREGETAGIPVSNVVTHIADAMKEAVGFNYFQQGVGTAASGPAPVNESGAKALGAIQATTGGGRQSAPATVAGMAGGFGKVG